VNLSLIISNALTLVADKGIPFFAALAGVGIVSMALLQVLKDFSRAEPRFHRRQIERWFGGRTNQDPAARQQLLTLAAGGNDVALYELSTPALMSQLSAASRVALAFPLEFELLLHGLAGSNAADEITTVMKAARAEKARRELRAIAEAPRESETDARARQQLQEDAEEARMRIAHLMERNLDALQISVSSRWELGNKWAVFVLSWLVTVGAFGVYFYVEQEGVAWSRAAVGNFALTTVATATFAAFVAPVAKDLVAALQRLRGPR
jgi:hypothetical protein